MADLTTARFGRRLATERARRGWSLKELGAKAGIDYSHLSRIERGDRGCTLELAVRVAALLSISLDVLTGPCPQCEDSPPPGYTCNDCGASTDVPPAGAP